jgi:cell division protein FtsW
MSAVMVRHLVFGIGLGTIGLLIASMIDYHLLQRFSLPIFIGALILTAAVFIPQLGFTHGGGTRWLVLPFVSVQPSEFLKLAIIIFSAAYFSTHRAKINQLQYGLGGLAAILIVPALILMKQPDIGTLGVICISVLAIFLAAGARARDIVIVIIAGICAVGVLAITKPYVLDRITTFLNPSENQQTEGYQIKQSLIAIGSGGMIGRGFGQGVQKFTYLPEPMGDSIFAVAGEEMGFIGATVIIGLFLAVALRGYIIAAHASDLFGALLVVGIATYLSAEAFINIASMLGVAPLTGIPLTFISQGGSAMLASLTSVGVLLGVSRRRKI